MQTNGQPPGFKSAFDVHFQNQILARAITDLDLLREARNLIKPEHFEGDEQWTLCSIAFDFLDKYGKAPGWTALKNEIVKHCRIANYSQERRAAYSGCYAVSNLMRSRGRRLGRSEAAMNR